MKASELRIGNWYDHNGTTEQISAWVINEVWEYERVWCKPIPLTREWLLKFGLKYSYIDKNRFFMLGVDIYIFNANTIIFNPSSTFLCVKLEYVHQLQNLYFALTGEELKQQEQ